MSNYSQEAKLYLHQHYKSIMGLYSIIFSQMESEQHNCTPLQLASKCAYYTVVSKEYLDGNPLLSIIESFIKNNGESSFNLFDKELATRVLMEAKIHDLCLMKLIEVSKDKKGNNTIVLTDLGKEEYKNNKDSKLDFDNLLGL